MRTYVYLCACVCSVVMLGGMSGGHYTACSKVEELVAKDLIEHAAAVRSMASSSASATGGGGGGGGGLIQGPTPLINDECYSSSTRAATATGAASGSSSNGGSASSKLPNFHFLDFVSPGHCIQPSAAAGTGINEETGTATGTTEAATRWLKFDDEFVSEFAPETLETTVVTGTLF
jgi:hypothetical protein